jgi:hypothetical protein
VWLPVTVNVPPEPVTVPTELLPSPQLMLAVKSPDVCEPVSVNVAMLALKPVFSLVETGASVPDPAPVTSRPVSVTVAVLVLDALALKAPGSVTVTVVVNSPLVLL